jgi:3,4-dihydroxy 2-butanone 4-phosphate synthase / GTP cyclohydrolase II
MVNEMNSIDHAVERIAKGGMVIVTDDERRENEGDLVMAAECATTDCVAFFLHHTSGYLCTAITPARAQALALEPMTPNNTEAQGTAFLVAVDYRLGTTTGISAKDRAATIRALADGSASADDFARPGHVLPLEAREGGVLKRAGHTEASVDLCTMAGRFPAGLLCEIVTPDRRDMMRGVQLERFARENDLPLVSIASLVRHRRLVERLVTRSGEAAIRTRHGEFLGVAYRANDGSEHLALTMGAMSPSEAMLVRVHSECLTGDVFGSRRCDCGDQLDLALQLIARAGSGAIVYLRGHEGRGIGLAHKLQAYDVQDRLGLDTVDANVHLGLPIDDREYGIGAAILRDLGVRRLRLMTNNPRKYAGLGGHGLTIVEQVPLQHVTDDNVGYLRSKRDRLGHQIALGPGD